MAFGIVCRHCGYDENDHYLSLAKKATQRMGEGVSMLLKDCPGYEPLNPEAEVRGIDNCMKQRGLELKESTPPEVVVSLARINFKDRPFVDLLASRVNAILASRRETKPVKKKRRIRSKI